MSTNPLYPKLPYRKSYYMKHPLKLFRHAVKSPIREFVQRGLHGWCVADTWSVDGYLNKIIPEMLDHLRANNHGWPGEPMTYEEWNGDGGIIDQIAKGFKANAATINMDYIAHGERYDHDKHAPMEEALQAQFRESMELFVKWYNALWD